VHETLTLNLNSARTYCDGISFRAPLQAKGCRLSGSAALKRLQSLSAALKRLHSELHSELRQMRQRLYFSHSKCVSICAFVLVNAGLADLLVYVQDVQYPT
jgi:hypothetical protein